MSRIILTSLLIVLAIKSIGRAEGQVTQRVSDKASFFRIYPLLNFHQKYLRNQENEIESRNYQSWGLGFEHRRWYFGLDATQSLKTREGNDALSVAQIYREYLLDLRYSFWRQRLHSTYIGIFPGYSETEVETQLFREKNENRSGWQPMIAGGLGFSVSPMSFQFDIEGRFFYQKESDPQIYPGILVRLGVRL